MFTARSQASRSQWRQLSPLKEGAGNSKMLYTSNFLFIKYYYAVYVYRLKRMSATEHERTRYKILFPLELSCWRPFLMEFGRK